MSTMWNTPRGEKLFKISLTGGLEDPDAWEFPTPEELLELLEAQTELMEMVSPEQTGDFVTSATEFLTSRGTTVHEFSLQAIARVRGQVPVQSARISLGPDGDSLRLTTTTSSDETMEDYIGDSAIENGAWDLASDDTVTEVAATSTSVDRFSIESGDYLGSTNTLYRPGESSVEFDTSDFGFWVHDYLFAMNLLEAERNLS